MNKRNDKVDKLLWVIIFVCLIVIVCTVFAIIHRNNQKNATVTYTDNNSGYSIWEVDGKRYRYNSNIISFLYMGVDTEDSFKTISDKFGLGENGRSDFMALVLLNRETKRINVLPLSRDLMVDIQATDASGNIMGWQTNHLTLAYSYGDGRDKSCMLSADAVSKMFNNIPILYYAATNTTSLKYFHNMVGDFDVTLPNDDLSYLGEGYNKGDKFHVTADNVEKFIRTRDTEQSFTNDGRMERQQAYIAAYIDNLKNALSSDLSGIVSKTSDISDHMVCNISLGDFSSLAELVLSYSFDPDKDIYSIEGKNVEGLHDEFYPDEESLKRLTLELFYKEVSVQK